MARKTGSASRGVRAQPAKAPAARTEAMAETGLLFLPDASPFDADQALDGALPA